MVYFSAILTEPTPEKLAMPKPITVEAEDGTEEEMIKISESIKMVEPKIGTISDLDTQDSQMGDESKDEINPIMDKFKKLGDFSKLA
jgi:hypothetical protein